MIAYASAAGASVEACGPERSGGSRALTRRGESCVGSPGGVAASAAKPPATVQYIYIYIYIYIFFYLV